MQYFLLVCNSPTRRLGIILLHSLEVLSYVDNLPLDTILR